MTIYLATDHAGFELKEKIKIYLEELGGHEVYDCGALTLEPGDDYPEYIARAAEKVQFDALHEPAMAVVFGGSGVGEAIVANRFRHVRAVVYAGGPLDVIKLSREHNDANVLSLGARFVTEAEAKQAVDLFFATPFSHAERHADRVIQIDDITQ
ncbi:MAG: RpiB/LacA/LacB family sugar-phosphate isomerase [Candidatus Pacebacteria bacterium]|nr:RpiB/LacA/LacB family sugar-phosphate isomerase [Candidatus Paceibacterota bacterium]